MGSGAYLALTRSWSRQQTGWTAFLIGSASGLLFALTSPGNRSEADDAFWYADLVEHAGLGELVQPLHPLYLPFMRLIFVGLRGLSVVERSHDALVIASVAAGATAVGLFVMLLKGRFGVSLGAASAGAGLLAVSNGFWRYAVEAEIYAVAALLTIAVLWAGLRGSGRLGRWPFVALLGAIATGAHILNAVATLVVVPAYLIVTREGRAFMLYVTTLAVLLTAGSVLAFRIARSTPEQGYIAFYLGEDARAHDTSVLVGGAIGFGQALVAGNFLFAYGSFRDTIDRVLPHRMLEDEKFTGRHADPASRVLPPMTLLALLMAVASAAWRRGRGHPAVGYSAIIAVAIGFLAYVGLLFAVDNPSQPEVWILGLPYLWVLVTHGWIGFGSPDRASRWLLVMVALGAHNYLGGMHLIADETGDRNQQKARWLLERATAEDVILTADSAGFARFLQYYSEARVLDLQFAEHATLSALYDDARRGGRRLYATGDVFAPPRYYEAALRDYGGDVPFEDLVTFGASIRDDFELVHRDRFDDVYVARENGGR